MQCTQLGKLKWNAEGYGTEGGGGGGENPLCRLSLCDNKAEPEHIPNSARSPPIIVAHKHTRKIEALDWK